MIDIQNLTFNYHDLKALNDISFQVPAGQICGYLGPNGAGKTTTVKILVGLLPSQSGRVEIAGHQIKESPIEVKKRIGYVPESGALYENLTPREFLRSMGYLHQIPVEKIDNKINEMISAFKLEDRLDEPMMDFSKGMKQKVILTSALLHNPDVLILDEPLQGLDVQSVTFLKTLLKKMAEKGKTIFYSSHLLEVVEHLCDQIIIIDKGHLVAQGAVSKLKSMTQQSKLESVFNQLVGDEDATQKADQIINRMMG